jgi:serine/threonine protein kinase
VDLLGSGKKNTKIYKALHIPTNSYYALKEVEAKSLDKLNEYKEEAVQLFKAQQHPNVIQFYGYFFYETMYNTFRIGIVCEYIEHKLNLEYIFRKRK